MMIDLILLSVLLIMVIWTVMAIRLVRSAVGLALTSVVLSILMFRLNASLAAVFELSVCAGLISVIFITTISFTRRMSKSDFKTRRRQRLSKFWPLPLIIIAAAILLFWRHFPSEVIFIRVPAENVRDVLWNTRHIDLFGQVLVLLAGAFGVVALFKENKK
ncbi:MAG: NADH-quinone oxidoreductase subunit J [Candidatus Omnitrophica bacterium]|nr:NADH-quinone oxidoreductase subunit J [Candidatus Omnitrophota bacterium]MDD5610255.1 NADH-quinone oxidoreductase subunit J [Candidatus Omnitrophota bacterium]